MAVVSALLGVAYHVFVYSGPGPVWSFAAIGASAGLLYAVPFASRDGYSIASYLAGSRRPGHMFAAWNMAFLGLGAIGFLTKTTALFPRGSTLLFYIFGLVAMIGVEAASRSLVVIGLRNGSIAPRRVMLVGTPGRVRAFKDRLDRLSAAYERTGVRVVATSVLPDRDSNGQGPSLAHALAQAAVKARTLLPDDIVLVVAWEDAEQVDACLTAFTQLPVPIHLDGGELLARHGDVQLKRVAGAATLSLADAPLSPPQVIAKRAFDVIGASIALMLAAPLLAAIAFAIRREQTGSVVFRQDRLGFNQRRFQIYKFRSMSASDNGAVVPQVGEDDPRITRIGRWIRRWNFDELPQLINVIKGEMSLVGPRPHAVAHDLDFEKRICSYPRRLNMKPGMTGWAQINGLRGLTDTDDKMRQRVEHDLYYIDNWSIALDAYILFMTVFSAKAFRNAR